MASKVSDGAEPEKTLGVLVGLEVEASLARRLPGSCVAVSAARPDLAAVAARHLAESGCRALLSFGLAGGLDPALRPGSIVLPEEVVGAGGSWRPDPTLRALLARQLQGGAGGRLYASTFPIVSRAAKAKLFGQTAACAVDMESGILAEAAEARGLPFLVLRVIADPASRGLPSAVLTALDEAGKTKMGLLCWSLLRRPRELPEFLALARDGRKALNRLARLVARWPARFP